MDSFKAHGDAMTQRHLQDMPRKSPMGRTEFASFDLDHDLCTDKKMGVGAPHQ